MASALTTNFNYTYPGILTTDIFFKPSLDSPALSDLAIIDPGISFRKQYNILNILSKILKPYAGCAFPTPTSGIPIGNTTLETKEFQVYMNWCKDDFTNYLTGAYNNLAQEWLKTGNQSYDLSGTPLNGIITQLIEDGLRRDVFRRISFGAQSSSSADWNTINGIWTRLIATSGGSNYCVVRATNALGQGTGGGGFATTLTAANALAALQAVWDQSNGLLKSVPPSKLKFWVTGSVFDAYVKSLQGVTYGFPGQGGSFQNTQDGIQKASFNGIDVVPIRLWDVDLADLNNPLYGTASHLILLTTKDNHRIGVENSGDLNKIEGWYDRTTHFYKFEGDMKFGYQYLHCDLQTIAY